MECEKGNIMENKNNTLSIAALVLGILGIVMDFTYTFAGLIIGIVGIVISVQARKKEGPNAMSTAGLVCSIVSVALAGAMYACAICAIGAFFGLAQI